VKYLFVLLLPGCALGGGHYGEYQPGTQAQVFARADKADAEYEKSPLIKKLRAEAEKDRKKKLVEDYNQFLDDMETLHEVRNKH
jgi:hypothetical protein